jgi:hypothetical protein
MILTRFESMPVLAVYENGQCQKCAAPVHRLLAETRDMIGMPPVPRRHWYAIEQPLAGSQYLRHACATDKGSRNA